MKQGIKLVFALFIVGFSIISCEKQEEIISENDLSFLTKEERIQNLNNLSTNFATYNNRVKKENSNLSKSNNSENQILLNDIILQSKSILGNLGLNENDLSEIPEEELEKFYVTFGAAIVTKHNSTISSTNSKSYAAKGDAWGCFKSAVGVDAIATLVEAGYELYAGETAAGWAVDSAAAAAFRKAGVQAAKKVITRWAGFFGAAVVVGEFLWCMAN